MYCKSFKNATLGQRLQVNYFFLKLAKTFSLLKLEFDRKNSLLIIIFDVGLIPTMLMSLWTKKIGSEL